MVLGLVLSDIFSNKQLVGLLTEVDTERLKEAPLDYLSSILGVSEEKMRELTLTFEEARGVLEDLEKNGCGLITIDDEKYPRLLRETSSPPCLLFYKGNLDLLTSRSIAIVGSRKPSLAGVKIARNLAFELAQKGFVIVSGLARGIDTAAHKGALEAGGATVAVLGTGIDRVYPSENQELAEDISRRGLLIAEYPPGVPPLKQNFPQRNRIISGLCLGTVVVEAGKSSGALITAGFALEENREVFAVPCSPLASQSGGVNRLLKEGATLVECADDIVKEIAPQCGGLRYQQDQVQVPVEPDQRQIMELLSNVPAHVDEIARAVGLGSAKTLALLFELETRGFVKSLPGKFYVRQ